MNRGLFGKQRVYLDATASLPASSAALRAFSRALHSYGNPSSPHKEGRTARDVLEEARTTIAREMEAKVDDIIFTSGATESNNIAIQGVKGFVNPSSDEGFTKPLHTLY